MKEIPAASVFAVFGLFDHALDLCWVACGRLDGYYPWDISAGRFIHPGVGLIYDYIAPPGTAAPWSHLPTPEEIAADRPNVSLLGTSGLTECAVFLSN